jgi:hypothetical protein
MATATAAPSFRKPRREMGFFWSAFSMLDSGKLRSSSRLKHPVADLTKCFEEHSRNRNTGQGHDILSSLSEKFSGKNENPADFRHNLCRYLSFSTRSLAVHLSNYLKKIQKDYNF